MLLIKHKTATFFALISLIFIIFYSSIVQLLIQFSEKNIKADFKVTSDQEFILKIVVIALIISFIFLSLFFFFGFHKLCNKYYHEFFDTKKVNSFFIKDMLALESNHNKYFLITGLLFSIIVQLYTLIFTWRAEEGLIETISALFFVVSAIILIIGSFKIMKLNAFQNSKKLLVAFFIFLSVGLIFIFLEEISYGQHLFGWESKGIFAKNNFQGETNIHNFFNPFFRFIYPGVGMSLFLGLTFIWLFFKKEKENWFELILPHPSLFFITFFIAASSFYGHNESFEELLSMFILLYSLRVYISIRHLKIKQST